MGMVALVIGVGETGRGVCTGTALEELLSSVSSECDEEDWGLGDVAEKGAEAENWGRRPEPKVGGLGGAVLRAVGAAGRTSGATSQKPSSEGGLERGA